MSGDAQKGVGGHAPGCDGWRPPPAFGFGRFGVRACKPGCPMPLHARIAELEAQVAGLEAMNTEKAAEIRRLRMGNHPAGRALRAVDEDAWRDLQVALDARDAEHEGGAS